MLRKVLKYIFYFFCVLLVAVLIFVVFAVGPVNRTPMEQAEEYTEMAARIEAIAAPPADSDSVVLTGFSKVNLTPPFRTATAGYGNRRGKLFTSVHDSIYVRTLVIQKGESRVAIVTADLLIIPPSVTKILGERLGPIGFSLDNTYLGATHSHNSIGNWAEGGAQFIYGAYSDTVVNFIASAIVAGIEAATARMVPSGFRWGSIAAGDLVTNRVIDGGPEDPLLRAIEVVRADSARLVLATFAAHATCLFSRDLELSRDYPGVFVDRLEARGYSFAMFMAGAVGSHGCEVAEFGWSCVDSVGSELAERLVASRHLFRDVPAGAVWMTRVPLALPAPQVKISGDWKIRAWLFESLFGEYSADLAALRIGGVVMFGTPCDYSGEFTHRLDSLAAAQGVIAMVTSFNGGYIGYVTPARYFDLDHHETRLMNWYPPGTGEYIAACLDRLMLRSLGRTSPSGEVSGRDL